MKPRLAGILLCAASAGCAAITPHLGFDNVKEEIASRAGLTVRWNSGTDDDRQARDAVGLLLQRELTADAAMQIALLNNRELQATYEELQIAQADLVQAGLLRNPVFSGDLRFAPSGGRPAVEMGIAQDFISILAMPLRKRRAAAAFEAAKLRVTAAVLDLAGEVRAAFYEAQADEQLKDMRQTVLEATAASYELAKRLRAAGNFRELDLANERALHEQSKLALASAESQAHVSRQRLNELMGLWGPEADWGMAARLPEVSADEDPESDEMVRQVLTRSLDLGIAAQQMEIAARTLGIIGATRLINEATVGISVQREVADNRDVSRERQRARYDYYADAFNSGFNQESRILPALTPHGAARNRGGVWSLGPSASIPVPIFDQGQADVTSAQARFRQSAARYFAQAVRVRTRLRTLSLITASARAGAVYYRNVFVPLRHRIVEETQLQYNAMQVSAFQLLQAKRDEIDAGAEYIGALRRYWISRSQLDLLLAGRMPSRGSGNDGAEYAVASDGMPMGDRHHDN